MSDAQILQQMLDMGEGSTIAEECEIILRQLRMVSSADMIAPLYALQRVRDSLEDADLENTEAYRLVCQMLDQQGGEAA